MQYDARGAARRKEPVRVKISQPPQRVLAANLLPHSHARVDSDDQAVEGNPTLRFEYMGSKLAFPSAPGSPTRNTE
jgi:hypothetical protein